MNKRLLLRLNSSSRMMEDASSQTNPWQWLLRAFHEDLSRTIYPRNHLLCFFVSLSPLSHVFMLIMFSLFSFVIFSFFVHVVPIVVFLSFPVSPSLFLSSLLFRVRTLSFHFSAFAWLSLCLSVVSGCHVLSVCWCQVCSRESLLQILVPSALCASQDRS